MELYGSDNPDYVNTPLVSPIPPPSHPTRKRKTAEEFKSARDQQSAPSSSPAAPFQISDVAQKLMKKTGWTEGRGLGKEEAGMNTVLPTVEKYDRTGLGYEPDRGSGYQFERKHHSINLNKEIPHHQEPRFLKAAADAHLTDLSDGLEIGRADEPIDYETFCSTKLVQKLWAGKDRFNDVPRNLFLPARYNANPYETIGRSIFQNRAAIKMANLDAMYPLTAAQDENGFLTFADICAGPGGFTEYILWRKQEKSRGWGFTLKGDCDFRLDKFNPQSPTQNFTPLYGADGTGNIYVGDNIRNFAEILDHETKGKGISLVSGDGGFSVEGEENFQEIKVRQLVLCQFLMALMVLKKGGNFVCKIFDTFTPFTVGLLYILYTHFDSFSLVKPYSSRPANSERYVVCLGLRERQPPVTKYLFAINEFFNKTPIGKDVSHIVDPELIAKNQEFVEHVRKSNIELLEQQQQALDDLVKYLEDPGLQPLDQNNIRKRCLNEWNIPDEREARARYRAPPPAQPFDYEANRKRESSASEQPFPKRHALPPAPKPAEKFQLTDAARKALERYKKK